MRKWSIKNLGFWDPNGSPRRSQLVWNNEKKRSYLEYSTVPAEYRQQVKEGEKFDQFLNFAIGLKKVWDMKVTVIPIIVGALGTVPKNLKRRLGRDLWNYGDCPDHSITTISWVIPKNPGGLRRLTFTQTHVNGSKLEPIGKTHKK